MNKKKSVAVLLFLMGITACIFSYCWIGTFLLFLDVTWILNMLTLRKMYGSVRPFLPRNKTRNLDYLIIGEPCNAKYYVEEGKTYIQLCAPGRNLHSSYEILRQTFSILNENGGTVIITYSHENADKKDFSIFDIPVYSLSPISIRHLRLERLKRLSRYPFYVSTIASICLLLNMRKSFSYNISNDQHMSFEEFCRKRNIRLLMYSDKA